MTEKPLETQQWPLRVPVEGLSERLEWVKQESGIPPRTLVSILVTIWLARVDEFRRLEEKFLSSGEYEESLVNHRVTITQLIAEGEALIHRAKEHGLSDLLKAKIEDLQATLESLVITFQAQYRNNLPPARAKAIAELFGAS